MIMVYLTVTGIVLFDRLFLDVPYHSISNLQRLFKVMRMLMSEMYVELIDNLSDEIQMIMTITMNYVIVVVFVVIVKIQQDYVFCNDDDGHGNAGYQDKADHEDDYGILVMIMLTLDTRAG